MTGRLTLPTDADIVDETIRLKNLLGADALRDCDGTEMPEALLSEPVKKYATYYTTRKDNEWAMQNPDEIQQEYLISDRVTAMRRDTSYSFNGRFSYRTVKSKYIR